MLSYPEACAPSSSQLVGIWHKYCNMAELSNENSPSTVPPPSTEPTVEESIPSREDASREDEKRKPNIGNRGL